MWTLLAVVSITVFAAASPLYEEPMKSTLLKRAAGTKTGRFHKTIYRGKFARARDLPFQVYVRTFLEDDDVEYCGGAIIGPRHVLTAAHCVKMPNKEKVCAVVGHENRFHSTTQKFTVVKEHVYVKKPNERVNGDIAVLMLDRSIPLGKENLQQIRLVGSNVVKPNTTCSISGWGENDDNMGEPNLLRQTKVPLVPHDICMKAYSDSQPDDLLCAGYLGVGGADACKGDSGGPLVCNGLLTGVVKSGKGCGLPQYPGTYTSVKYYWKWIKKVMVDDMRAEAARKTKHRNMC